MGAYRLLAPALACLTLSLALPTTHKVSFRTPDVVEAGGIHNIYIDYHSLHDGELSIVYGDCDLSTHHHAHHMVGTTHVGSHDLAKRHVDWEDQRPTKFVWLAPEDVQSGGCLAAFSDSVLIGRSEPLMTGKRQSRRWVAAAEVMDAMGPWFDGVEYLKEKEPDEVFVAKTKSQKIGILGGGMSGLMTAHILDSVGFYDWEIIEASARIGGRVHTAYLNASTPDEYQYQEMGPMRFPVSINLGNETLLIQDHRLVFQLADEMNKYNNYDPEWAVNFIKWIQTSANEPSSTTLLDTTSAYANASDVEAAEEDFEDFVNMTDEKKRLYVTNVFRAHKQAVAQGLFDFSESAYLRYKLGFSLNTTDQADAVNDFGPIWPYEDIYFTANDWRTIDKGLTQLPRSFGPQVVNRTRYQTTVEGMSWNATSSKMSVIYRTPDSNPWAPDTVESSEYDYAIVAVPFTKVRLFHPMPNYSSLLSRAISRLNYSPACKVALHYRTRFWEHLPKPIIGGCGSGGGIPGISSVCYPSYQINSSLPGVILASYISGDTAESVAAWTDEQHVSYVQRAMIEIHGPIAREQFTGAYERKCWREDQYQAGAWASPTMNQQQLYLPAYFQTEKHTVFIGEHTSYTHAWIFSALESAVRGSVQLLLDMGLVDEAKAVNSKWMARWIEV
ncbi:hypothetical protein K431DRAFT_272344 [Polychaeton citri CBS 116435]|uniref:Amine oxidase domain-containing protein n=1 Tax=Polychaeton citri CBS 116435 TaxID=1314669 RepID=A0A9P4Q6Z5_9PEZI|nr:hypothetical protein K431DRAFT_272344 [Polychaeton citri CBS 116435]